MEKEKINLDQYYNSKEWWRFRNFVLKMNGNKCAKCGFKYELNIHHKHYKTLGNEDISDLTVLCKRCHNDLHFKRANK